MSGKTMKKSRPKILKSAADIKRFCRALPYTPVGLGVFAFDRYGLQAWFPSYEIIALRNSTDIPLLSRDCGILALENGKGGLDVAAVKKMNHTIIARSDRAIHRLKQVHNPVLVPPQSKKDMGALAKRRAWMYAAPPHDISTYFENKKNFRQLLRSLKIPAPRCRITTVKKAAFAAAAKELGLPFIIQAAESRGGRGTFLVRTRDDMVSAIASFKKQKAKDIVLSAFVKGLSVSTTAVATRWGVFSSNIQTQVVETEMQASFGDFLGHDWSHARSLPQAVHARAIRATKSIGRAMYKKGFRGFFGVDFLVDQTTGRLYAIECNPRFTGALPTADLIQARLGRPLFCGLHVLEFIADRLPTFRLQASGIQKMLEQQRTGSHLVVSSPFDNATIVTCALKPGTYELIGRRLTYRGNNLDMKNLANNRQVIITQMLPPKSFTPAHGIICRVISKSGILNRRGELTTHIRAVREAVQGKTSYAQSP